PRDRGPVHRSARLPLPPRGPGCLRALSSQGLGRRLPRRGSHRGGRGPQKPAGRSALRPVHARSRSLTRRAAVLRIAGAALLLAACGKGAGRTDRILLVTLDTTRADRLGCYGRAQAETPTLGAFATESTLFEDAVSAIPVTMPSHATMMTGLNPYRHGVR